jgi:hypothetical protein
MFLQLRHMLRSRVVRGQRQVFKHKAHCQLNQLKSLVSIPQVASRSKYIKTHQLQGM